MSNTIFYSELPKVDKKTVEYVNYIFERLSGMIKTMDFSAENENVFNSRKREYTFMLMEKKINDSKIINLALEKIRNAKLTFLPSPGEFYDFCKQAKKELCGFDTQNLQQQYQDYVGRIKSDQMLGLISKEVKALPFLDWQRMQ